MERQRDSRPPAETDDRVEGIYAIPESYEATLPPDERRRVQDDAYLREMADVPVAPALRAGHVPPPAIERDEPRVLSADPWAWQARRSRQWRRG